MRTNVFFDEAGDDWLADQNAQDRITKSARVRALVVLARTDPTVADRAVEKADELRQQPAPSPRRLNISLADEDQSWLIAQDDIDRITMSERIRALVALARTDPAVAERAVDTADELRRARRAKRGGGGG